MLEAELMLPLRAAGAVMQTGPMSHPNTDVDKTNGVIKNIFHNLMNALPYATAGDDQEKGALQREREEAAEEAKKMWKEEDERFSRRVDTSPPSPELDIKKVNDA